MLKKIKRLVDESVLEQRRSERCWVCAGFPCDPSHIKTVGSFGPDTLWNVVPHCRKHHTEWGQIGWSKFFAKYPWYAEKIYALGWYQEGLKLYHPLLATSHASE